MIRKMMTAVLSTALSLVLLASCTGNARGNSTSTTSKANDESIDGSQSANSESGETGFPVTVTDSNGDSLTLDKTPERIVVIDYAVLDMLELIDYQGEIMTASDNLPGYLADSFSDSPSSGTLKELDMEAINEFGPELIFIAGRQLDYLDDLRQIAPTLYFSADTADFLNSTLSNLREMAKVFGATEAIEAEISLLNKKVESVKAITSTADALSLVILTNDGAISAYGSGSRFGFLFDDLGLVSVDDTIEASTHGQSISYEYISEKNPDIIFYVDRTAVVGGSTESSTVLDNELIMGTKAGQSNRIYSLDPEYIYSAAGGLQSLTKTLDEVESALAN